MRARSRPGIAIAAMIPMIATTINSSMSVNPWFFMSRSSPFHARRETSSLQRYELRGGLAAPLAPEPAGVVQRGLGVVFLEVGAVHHVAQPLAARLDGSDLERAAAAGHLQRADRIHQERAPPAARLQRPRAYEHTAFGDDRPDADEPVRGSAGADAEVLAVAHQPDHGGGKALSGHRLECYPSRSCPSPTPTSTSSPGGR